MVHVLRMSMRWQGGKGGRDDDAGHRCVCLWIVRREDFERWPEDGCSWNGRGAEASTSCFGRLVRRRDNLITIRHLLGKPLRDLLNSTRCPATVYWALRYRPRHSVGKMPIERMGSVVAQKRRSASAWGLFPRVGRTRRISISGNHF